MFSCRKKRLHEDQLEKHHAEQNEALEKEAAKVGNYLFIIYYYLPYF